MQEQRVNFEARKTLFYNLHLKLCLLASNKKHESEMKSKYFYFIKKYLVSSRLYFTGKWMPNCLMFILAEFS